MLKHRTLLGVWKFTGKKRRGRERESNVSEKERRKSRHIDRKSEKSSGYTETEEQRVRERERKGTNSLFLSSKPGYDPAEMFVRHKPYWLGVLYLFFKLFLVYFLRLRMNTSSTHTVPPLL